jgi:hypothetical protein
MALRMPEEERLDVEFADVGAPDDIAPLIAQAQQQQRPLWCWAACCAMVVGGTQCGIAASVLKDVEGCCDLEFIPPSILEEGGFEARPCDQSIDPSAIDRMWTLKSVPFSREDVLSEDALKAALRRGQPVLVQQGSVKRHVLLVVGLRLNLFQIADPFFPGSDLASIDYDELKSRRDGWKRSWILR